MNKLLLFAVTTMLGATLTFAQTTPGTPAPSQPTSKASSTTKTKKHHKKSAVKPGSSTPASAATTTKSK